MSQFRFESAEYTLLVGVDHVTSAFFQIWKNPIDEQDAPFLAADNQGVRTTQDLPIHIQRLVERLKKTYQLARSEGNFYPNLGVEHIYAFTSRLDIPVTEAQLVRILD